MPFGDGTGPAGRGQGLGNRRGGRDRGVNNYVGAGGYCICPNCGEKLPHQIGKPCSSINCPNCGTGMIRQE